MEFSKELRENLKTYFFNRFGIVLSDDKANSYLYSLGSLGIILAELPDIKTQSNITSSDVCAFAERSDEHRKAHSRKVKGTALVTQCPHNAIKSKLPAKKRKKYGKNR